STAENAGTAEREGWCLVVGDCSVRHSWWPYWLLFASLARSRACEPSDEVGLDTAHSSGDPKPARADTSDCGSSRGRCPANVTYAFRSSRYVCSLFRRHSGTRGSARWVRQTNHISLGERGPSAIQRP